jgi:hypothetical protein
MLFITSVTIPVIGKIDDDYEKKRVNKMLQNGVDQEQTHQDGRGFTIFYGQSCAQGFVPTIDLLTAVQLYIFSGDDVASGYEITVSIRDDLDGDDLTSVTVNADQVGDYKWLSFDFPDIDITPGDKYYIVASSDDGGADVEETYAWFYGEGDLYSNGNPWTNYSDSGWQEAGGLQIVDFCFKTWFTEEVSNNLFEFKLIELFEDYTNIIRLFKYIF